jgi:magnesium transporter
MPLADADVIRRRSSIHLPANTVDFILYSYNEYSFEERKFHSVNELLRQLKLNDIENTEIPKKKLRWIEVINRSSIELPRNIQILCEYFNIHPLTIEDIATLSSYMKLDLFDDTGGLYLLMKILTWSDKRVQQQQISFYLNCSQNLLITFQEKSLENTEPFFQKIKNRLRKKQFNNDEQYQNTRLRQLNVDYLFYCLLDDIIDR